ncbi:uncharacterized protein LY89DRAFT_763279 [Mollisia scopiformis]|uniref:BTB domain-containing protein n=1 Tax=Mollisia scopiformis TaxID=149040 RepID=A0A194XRL9_MOLSC|nr:uncharacterized protein LY89DRAFT_763279 [Mollisia scopiformis]KUJ22796.1 hypothetical protein LY89DRAFT_763279 [Mollisia scopiformis]
MVHKDFACHYSPVFQAAFNSSFIEGQTQEYRLQDTSEIVVRVLINWFYTKKVDVEALGFTGESIKTAYYETRFISLVELWILAEKLLIPELQNMVIREFYRLKLAAMIVPTSCFHAIYEDTVVGSPLRRLCVDICVVYLKHSVYRETADQIPHDMFVDLVARFSSLNRMELDINIEAYQVAEQ